MKNLLFESLEKDHQVIRERLAELKTLVNRSRPDDERCLELFRILKATVVAHAKAEEFVLYAVVEEPHNSPEKELQHFAYEGYEEHDLIDFLMKEMGTAEEITLQWRAQLNVLGEMLEHHLSDEEEDFFPKISVLLPEKSAMELGEAYAKERDIIFAKKIGIRPAISLAPSLHH